MAYGSVKEWTVKLDDIDAPGLWVTFVDPWSLPVEEHRHLRTANVIVMRQRRDSVLPTDEELWAFTALDDAICRGLLRWNLPVMKDGKPTDEILPIDGIEDPFNPVPIDVFRFLADAYQERMLQPPKSGRS